jgi:hypothetical protein
LQHSAEFNRRAVIATRLEPDEALNRRVKPTIDDAFRPRKSKPEHPLQWLAEPLADEPSFVLKSWFGGRTIMLHGRHHLFLTTQGEPWQGVLVCTFHEHQASLRTEFPALVQHPVLKKWLYLPESVESFERDARRLVQLVRARDSRLGILPSAKKKRRTKRLRFGDKP